MILNYVIDGSIGAGKTTLLHNLKNQLESNKIYHFHEENVTSWSQEGWLQKYYTNIPRYAASFQTRVLLSHIQQRIDSSKIDNVVNIFERSAYTTVNVFSKMLVEDGMMDQLEMNLHQQILEMFNYKKPDLLIYLNTRPEMSYQRLIKRNRNGESTISLEYLKKLDIIYQQQYENLAEKVVVIDGSQSETKILEEVLKLI